MSAELRKVAFIADGFIWWTGGVDFLRLCIAAMDSISPGVKWPVLIPRATPAQRAVAVAVKTKRRLWSLAGIRPAVFALASNEEVRETMASVAVDIEIVSYDASFKGLHTALRNLGADVVLPCFRSPGRNFPVKWIGYYADLQHKAFPRNFSRRERLKREWELRTLLADASALIVPSKSVVRDIEKYYPGRKAALFALPFSPLPRPEFLEDSDVDSLRAYELPQQFFIISNQFWVHKSHQTAFSALRLLRDRGFNKLYILCTGSMHDFRAPAYFEYLRKCVARDGLSDRIRFLGVIPKKHQLAIMRRAIALLQPTLFEGGPGGLSVFDAVSTATPAIISDIDTNREVDLGMIQFFRAGSADDLAEKMLFVLKNPPARLSLEATLAMLRQRQRELGATLLDAISYVYS